MEWSQIVSKYLDSSVENYFFIMQRQIKYVLKTSEIFLKKSRKIENLCLDQVWNLLNLDNLLNSLDDDLALPYRNDLFSLHQKRFLINFTPISGTASNGSLAVNR